MLIQSHSNGDTEAGALMFVFDFDKVAYQLYQCWNWCVLCVLGNVIMFVIILNVS